MSTQPPADQQAAPTTPAPPAPPPVRQRTEVTAFDPNDPIALYMNTGIFDQLQRVGALMAKSTFVPDHFRAGFVDKKGKEKDLATATGDCFLVAAQSFRWGMDPFAVAQDTYVIGGKLGYGGKVIGAVVNMHPRVERGLDYTYSGSGDGRKIVATASLRGLGARSVEGTVGQWKTDNPKWREQPDQQLAYRANREWARRWIPEAIFGVNGEEDATEVVDITPTVEAEQPRKLGLEPLKEKLRAEAETKRGEPSQVEQMSVDLIRAAVNELATKAGVPPLDPDAPDAEKETTGPGVVVPAGKRKDGSTCGHESMKGARIGAARKRLCPECDVELSQAQCDALGPV